ncbi:MAG: nickel-dependent lactate racemase [Actinomycetota bacterium]|nr:nickel-dependent lactate racemase [Actinomycetota bacterium]
MRRIPLLVGTRIWVVSPPDGAVVLHAPPPDAAVADVGAAVRDALRFPLAGEPLEALVPRGGRVTIVVEPPSLPIPGSPHDPRQLAVDATVSELERMGVPLERQTILVATGLARRPGVRDLETLVPPELARRFRGAVEVHDAEDDTLVELARIDGLLVRANRALVECDAVVSVTAAETVLHGGPAALVAATDANTVLRAHALSLLEPASAESWELGVAVERAVARRVPVIGTSLVLNHPRTTGALRGFPYGEEAVERVAGSPFRRLYSFLPALVRERVLHTLPVELSVSAAFAGPPSVAHAEALLRGIELRSVELDAPLDALCIPIPRTTPYLPRERPNPLLAAFLGLGIALRLWRDAFPLVERGTAILLHRFHRHFSHPTQQPYRVFFQGSRTARHPEALADAERSAAADERALAEYRAGRACHPLLPFADWAACRPALERLGAVLVAGCRDSAAARELGFVPTHGLGAALEMVRGRSGPDARIGFLLAPPYFPIRTPA